MTAISRAAFAIPGSRGIRPSLAVTPSPLTMDAAARFWQDKILLGPSKFSQLSDDAKIRAFGISGIAKGAELTTVFNSLQAAIEKGISFSDFKKECAEIFARRGWTGKRDWRVQNIFRTNIQTAYNSGRWQSQKEKAGTFPYLQYNAVNDRRTRPTHKAMDGKVFPIDHPFWDIWYPPNGFRCRCSTLSLTEKQVERMGLTVETEDPTNTPIAIPNPVTGEKIHVQQLLPDPGFNHHPGKVVWGGVGDTGAKTTFTAMDDLAEPSDYQRPILAKVKTNSLSELNEGSLLPTALSPKAYRDEFIKRFGQETVLKDAIGEPVILTLAGIDQEMGPMIPLLEQLITQPFEIWLTPEQGETGRIRLAKRYLGLWRDGDATRAAMLAVSEARVQGLTTAAAVDDLDQVEGLRRGLLLHPGRKK